MIVCMVCTGNTCRSPMAEAFLSSALKRRGRGDINVCSAGLSAFPGAPAADDAQEAMAEYGIDLSGHRAQGVLSVPKDALFLTMTNPHLRGLKAALPESSVHLYLEYAGEKGELSDPYGMGTSAYRILASRMERAAEAIAERILRGE